MRKLSAKSEWSQKAHKLALPLLFLAAATAARAQISLYTATDLALRNSPEVRMSVANVERAAASLSESRDVYIPSFAFGSNLGYSYGFPVGQPSIYSMTAQSLVFSFSQKDYMRAARMGLRSAELDLKSKRNKVLNETATDYVELVIDTQKLNTLDDEQAYTQALIGIEQARVEAGVDPRIQLLQAQLTSAQIDLARIHTQQDAALMRVQLAHLTGLNALDFAAVASSIPPMPAFSTNAQQDEAISANNPEVLAAYDNAQSKVYQSIGDSRKNLRPLLSFGAQYSRYARFNNYDEYYQRFQSNNFGFGIDIRIPIFDESARAQARQSAAEANYAEAQAKQTQQLISENLTKLRGSVSELNAQERVAQLQSEIAQAQLASIETQFNSGTGQPGAKPVTPMQADQAHIEERQRYLDLLNARLALMSSQLGLLQMTGGLESWIQSAPQK